ncbi:MAG: cobalt ECF transporter T component CbiQ [Methanosphaera sp. rholeuAM130]|nr:cobalt ECF transporter T component CbiQ [Methanosphaera sp.]RAP54224.1 MAG: cobalt ECF transporter T component CbiQ [Methanosphaera sp. rholeuAM130]
MVSASALMEQELLSSKDSVLHNIDSRVKLIVLILTILFAVTTTNYTILLIVEIYLLLLVVIAKIPLKQAIIKVLVILPFGVFIALFQPFIQPGDVLYSLPFGINVTLQGLQFAQLLLSRLVISITAIVLFSFITPMKSIAEAFRRLHMPNEFAMIFSLFVRFIFLFYDEFESIRQAQSSRCFSLSNKTPYTWKLKQVGYLFLMMFIRSYEQGESVYNSMASRGYSASSTIYYSNEKLSLNSIIYLVFPIILFAILTILNYLHMI